MKLGVVTLYTNNIKEYGILSATNKRKYSEKHGYACIVGKKILDTNRAAAWSKIMMIKKLLRSYDWIFWTDADSLIMNMNVNLEDLIHKHLNKDTILTKGVSSPINTGQWLIKNSKWSHELLDKIWCDTPGCFLKNNPWEQGSLVSLLSEKTKAKMAILDHRVMNSIPNIRYIDLDCSPKLNRRKAIKMEYKNGDFIVHFMFSKNYSKRVAGMKYYSRKVTEK